MSRSQFIRQGRYVEDSLKVAHYLERDVKVPQLLLLQGRALGIDREPAIADWLTRKKEEILIREMRRLATAHEKPVTEQEMRAHYEAHPKSYQTSSMVEVVEIQVEEEAQARELLSQNTRRPAAGRAANRPSCRNRKGRAHGERVAESRR